MNDEEDGGEVNKWVHWENEPCSAVLKWKHDSFTFAHLQWDNEDSEMGGP